MKFLPYILITIVIAAICIVVADVRPGSLNSNAPKRPKVKDAIELVDLVPTNPRVGIYEFERNGHKFILATKINGGISIIQVKE